MNTLSTPTLIINDLVAGYEDKPVIEINNFSVQKGEVVAILGQSGCGKSTLFLTIAGLLNPLEGKISLNGESSQEYIKDNIAITLQNFPLFHWLTVRQNLEMAAKVKGVEDANFDDTLRQFNALHLANQYPNRISGGERCRASISQALLNRPSLLLLDEPFTGLDTLVKQEISKNIFDFVRENQTSALFITHDIYNAVEWADRIIVLGTMTNGSIQTNIYKEVDVANTQDVGQIIGYLRDSRGIGNE